MCVRTRAQTEFLVWGPRHLHMILRRVEFMILRTGPGQSLVFNIIRFRQSLFQFIFVPKFENPASESKQHTQTDTDAGRCRGLLLPRLPETVW
jgi:hypothetical protein